MASENEMAVFKMISKHRAVFLSSPLWLAAILIILSRVAGPGAREVINFMTASPLR